VEITKKRDLFYKIALKEKIEQSILIMLLKLLINRCLTLAQKKIIRDSYPNTIQKKMNRLLFKTVDKFDESIYPISWNVL
jgi:hypothetical protein